MAKKLENQLAKLVERGDVDEARKFVAAHSDVLKRPYGGFRPWLVHATNESSAEIVQFLLEQGLDVNEPETSEGEPWNWPLRAAVRRPGFSSRGELGRGHEYKLGLMGGQFHGGFDAVRPPAAPSAAHGRGGRSAR